MALSHFLCLSQVSPFGITNQRPHPISIAPLSAEKTSKRISVIRSTINSESKTSLENDRTNIKNNMARRSGNYSPTIWHFDYVQSLTSHYGGLKYIKRANKLKEELRVILEKETNPLSQLELIDMLQRLGIAYHFEDEIEHLLKGVFVNKSNTWKENNLHATALEFRLLRQHGFSVTQEVFNTFKDKHGHFKASMSHDTIGLISLYEASFHLLKNESVLEEARVFTTKHLEEYMERNKLQRQDYVSMLVGHALELPLHWRLPRVEATWFIEAYQRRPDMNSTLLELAKLDFNIVQSVHQEDLKHASRWWNETGFGQKLSFARDRLVESFMWAMGMTFEPQFGYCRRMSTRVNALITILDDIYDVYGTVDELELFTNAIERWDVNAIDHLPDYMKLSFLNLHNAVNEMAFDVFKEQGYLIIKYLKKAWADLCKAYLLEAKWYHSGYMPTMEEYIENAWISISTQVILMHVYICSTNPITKESMECLDTYPSIIRQSAMLLRFADDLGTSPDEMKRGDAPKSIECYMNEAGVSEDEARQHVKYLIREAWKQLNEDRLENSLFSRSFIEAATDLARVAICLYLRGDGHGGVQQGESKDRVLSLFVNPI